MATTDVRMTINASGNDVWKTLSEFGGVEKYVPGVVGSNVEGSGVGATRTVILKDHTKIFERLERLDEQERILRFTIINVIAESPLPFKDYVGTMKVQNMGDNQCEVQILSTFETQGLPEGEVIALLEGMHSQAIKELEKLHGS